MTVDLASFEENTSRAVSAFWDARDAATLRQQMSGLVDQGERAGVTSGKNMDGFVNLIADLVAANGLHDAHVYLSRGVNTLPGFFRPTKDWDVLVMRRGVLIAAIELKSQVGPSFGNNFNNRAEEAIGSALDLWTAYRERAFGDQPKPFVGWLMHVEDAPRSRRPTTTVSPHFSMDAELQNASYLDRYDVLCRRLVLENLYTETALITSTREGGLRGVWGDVSESNSLRRFVASFSGHIAAEASFL